MSNIKGKGKALFKNKAFQTQLISSLNTTLNLCLEHMEYILPQLSDFKTGFLTQPSLPFPHVASSTEIHGESLGSGIDNPVLSGIVCTNAEFS